mmetsp:Transcript_4979/g.19953  ORF Transcript_4979/g.19953 Transcript_4979/m.19953 type:complete len:302 (-) Transcript_4979:585-1490(-)
MWSLGCLSVDEDVARSAKRTALFSCGCKYVRALNVVCALGSGSTPQHETKPIFSKCAAKSETPCFLPSSCVLCVLASIPNTKRGGVFGVFSLGVVGSGRSACLSTASTTGIVARPFVSPWNEASTYRPPSFSFFWEERSTTRTQKRSPGATPAGASFATKPVTAVVVSPRHDGSSTSKRFFEHNTRLFWSRFPSNFSGYSTWYRSPSSECDSKSRTSAAAASCTKNTSQLRYAGDARMSSVRRVLFSLSAFTISLLTPCHFPGASLLTRCTRMPSNAAMHAVCRGTEMASSDAVTAGYLLI